MGGPTIASSVLDPARRRPMAACVASLFALGAPAALANTVIVQNCDDTGAGSLRQSIASASTGDTVSLQSLPAMCNSVITLTSGAIAIEQPDLTLQGPPGRVAVLGPGNDRVFNHGGDGTLHLNSLNIALGHVYSTTFGAYGGCVLSKGSVALLHSGVFYCSVDAPNGHAGGGGVFAKSVTALYSTISFNAAGGKSNGGLGGGVVARTFLSKYSTISENVASNRAGGVMVYGDAVITHTTISGNHSISFGGLRVLSSESGHTLVIAESTISGNSAVGEVGGVQSNVSTTVQNSTIAFNTAGVGKTLTHYTSPALNVDFGAAAVTLQSSLLANNTYGTTENDFSTSAAVTVGGANNFVRASFDSLPASGLIFGQCALLGPLRDNGGPTRTHQLLSHSPAIDAGNNVSNEPFGSVPYSEDQRGSGYPRVSGAQPDIGTYEVDRDEIVFNTSFEGC